MQRSTIRSLGTALVVLLAVAFATLVPADARDKTARRYMKLYMKVYEKADESRWEDVLYLTRKMDKLAPEATNHLLFAAQGHANLGHRALAYEQLEKLIAPGWTSSNGIRDMKHLGPLQGDARFEALNERAAELGEAFAESQQTVHTVLPLEEAEVFDSVEALVAAFDERMSALNERAILAHYVVQRRRVNAMLDAKIAAIGRYLADHPQAEDREQAALAAVQTANRYKEFWTPIGGEAALVIDRADRFIAGWPDSEHRPEVELMRAVAAWKNYWKDEKETTLERRTEEATPLFLALEERFGDAPEATKSKVWRLGGAVDRSDGEITPAIAALYAEIEPAFEEDEELEMYAWEQAARAMFQLKGEELFDGVDLDGNRWNWETMNGNVVLIDFWATWCGPCVAEIPRMKEALEKYREAGFRIVGVSLDGLEQPEFLEECDNLGVEWPQIFDGKGWDAALARKFNIWGVPTPVLLDRNGRVVGVHDAVRGDKLLEQVGKLIDAGRP